MADSPRAGAAAPLFRQVPAGRGLAWWSEAWPWLVGDGRLGAWLVISLLLMLAYPLLGMVPLVGPLAVQVLSFILFGGLMLAARKCERREPLAIADLFSGFGRHGGPLALLGIVVLVANLLVVGLMAMVGAGAVLAGLLGAVVEGPDAFPGLAAGVGLTTSLLLLGCLALFIPIGLAAWLSPALVVLEGMQPLPALRRSLSAGLANPGALTVYGLLLVGFAVLASVPAMLGWFLLAPLLALSSYAAYKDVLEAPDRVEVIDAGTI